MATRKAITLVSGLFQEVNTPTDKLDFAGNTTADLTENTNLYYTDARSRAAVSVTDSGGFGSLSYNNSTGVITYVGTSNSDVRGTLSIASGSGLTYNSGTGEFGTNAIPNGQLANSSLTIGNTSVALGATASTVVGLNALVSAELIAGSSDGAANSIKITLGDIIFEGSTADANETILTAADASGGDKTLTLPNETGTILSTASSIANSNLANSAITIGSTSVSLGATQGTFAGLTSLASTTLVSGTVDGANSITLASGNITFEGSTADGNEIILTAADASGSDKTITLPNATGTVALLSTLSIASGSGLTYNSGTGEFSTNAIPNSQLANSSVTVGSTAIALGNSSTTLAGLSSVTSTAVITNDSGFRIRDNSDNTKQLAFECSGISGSTTRTLTVPNANGTIATQAYVQAQITAEDLDVQTDSGNFDVDLDSEPLILTGGTGINTSGSGTTATFAIDSTVTTLTGSQTLTNKTLTSPVLNGTISGTSIKDEDNMSSNSASHLATQQSIKAYVDTEIAGVPQGDITAVTAGTGLSGGGTSGGVTLSVPNSGVSAGSYGSGTAIPSITVDARGFVTAISTNSVNTTTNLGVSTSTTAVTVTSSTGNNATINEASGSAAGVMSVAHHDKLDGIAAGATNVSNTNQLTNGAGFITSSSNISGNAATATKLATARTIAGVSFDGSANISLNNNAITNGAGYLTSVGTSNISNNAVTFAKLEDVAQNHIVGRISSGTGDAQELNASEVRSIINVENGATADQSASEILTLLKTVDGAGSGLDADTLDGISSGSFIRSDANDTVTGDITFSGGAAAVVIAANSDLRFTSGSWTGNATKIQSSGNYLYIVGDSNGIVFRDVNGTNRVVIDSSGHFVPQANTTYDMGLTGNRWRNGYFQTLYGDGSNLTGISAGATGGGSDQVFYENDQNVTTNYTITNGKNAMSAGPITINSGVTVTVGSGETYTIV